MGIQSGSVDIVVPTALLAGVRIITDTLASVAKCTSGPYRVILVVNSDKPRSQAEVIVDGILAETKCNAEVIVMDGTAGFSRPCNVGMAYASADWICLLSDDVVVPEGWDVRLQEAVRQGYDIALPAIREPGRVLSVQKFLEPGLHSIADACFVCVMFPRSTIEKYGLLSMAPQMAMLGNDNEYCRRIIRRKGKIAVDSTCIVNAGFRTTIGKIDGNKQFYHEAVSYLNAT